MSEDKETRSETIIPQLIEDEMKQSYVDYSMSVIIGRALPDVRDGLKPVHRRILFAMNEMGITFRKPFRKSARIVGETLGKFHPHGDTAVYDALVRMAQVFSLRYPFIMGQGNFGSIDGDRAAAMRYCITGDSLILTNKGIIPIKTISKKKESKINLKILSNKGKRNKAVKFFNSGKHNIFKISTELGYNIKGSFNHPLLCWTFKKGLLQTEWKLLEKIQKNDVVLLNRNHSLFATKNLNTENYIPKNRRNKQIGLPKKMNTDLAFVLGALVSEGSFHQNKILFNNSDMVYYNHVKNIIYEQFKGVSLYERKISGNCLELCIYHQHVVEFLKNIGLTSVKSDKKEIPFSVLRSTKKVVVDFLKGLFEGDGSVIFKVDKRHKGKSIELTYNSKSKLLIKQLKIVLLNLGIVTTKPYIDKRNGCYKLIVSGFESINVFKKEVGFLSERKSDILSNIENLNPTRMSKTDYIPYFNKYLRNKYKISFILKNNFDRYNKLEKNYKKLIKIIDKKDKKLIDGILANKYLFNKVSAIKKLTKQEVYSVKVDSPCHSFTANGFINHNTEAKLAKISAEMLDDIDKETVNFIDNFDGSMKEPTVLPSKIPNLLINGSTGIAVGMATNIPPHNITEVCDATLTVLKNPEIDSNEVVNLIPGPDFPTGGMILGKNGIRNAYATGHGKIKIRAKTSLEEKKRTSIIIDEIPYMVNKTLLIEEIARYVRNKVIPGIADIRDESDRDGMRVVLTLKREANPDVVLNQLYKHSRMQTTQGINLLALTNGKPKVMPLKEMLVHFISHRKEVVTRRTTFELKKAEERAHILEGLIIALDEIDKAIALIKKSSSGIEARNTLMSAFGLTEIQSQAILDMKLQRLTSLEQNKIRDEHKTLLELIIDLKDILASNERIIEIIKDEILEIKEKYADERKTKILDVPDEDIDIESLIEEEDVVVTISHSGYIKRTSLNLYREQRRGGKGMIATTTKEEDFVEHLFIANTHDYILFFTDKGIVHWLKVYKIPDAGRYSGGKAIVNLLNSEPQTKITAYIKIREFDDKHYLIMATKGGIVKKTNLMAYSRPRAGGIRAITLGEKDSLINVALTDGEQHVLLATKKGRAVKFKEVDARTIGRTSKGVRGIRLKGGDEVVSMVIPKEDDTLLTITENGYGKRTRAREYRLINRGGVGVINIICSERNGNVVDVKSVDDEDQVMFISKNGIIIRTATKGISVIGRNTQGLRLMRMNDGDRVVTAAKVAISAEEPNERESETEENEPAKEAAEKNEQENKKINIEPNEEKTVDTKEESKTPQNEEITEKEYKDTEEKNKETQKVKKSINDMKEIERLLKEQREREK